MNNQKLFTIITLLSLFASLNIEPSYFDFSSIFKEPDIQTFGNAYLNDRTITNLKSTSSKIAWPDKKITLAQAVKLIAASELNKEKQAELTGQIMDKDLKDYILENANYYKTPFDVASSQHPGALINDLYAIAQKEVENELAAKELAKQLAFEKKARKLRKDKDSIIERFFREPLDVPGAGEYKLKFFNEDKDRFQAGKTTVQHLLTHVAITKNNRYNTAEAITRNMSLEPKYQALYFHGPKPIITEDVINQRLEALRAQLSSAAEGEAQ